MSVYRTTVFWGQATDGASETYWTPDQGAASACVTIQQMLNLRTQMLNQLQYWQGVRVAVEGTKRSSQLFLPGSTPFFDSGKELAVPGAGTLPPTGSNGLADQFRAVLQLQVRFGTARSTYRYLSGIPDAISLTEPVTFTRGTAQTWWNAFDAWRSYLLSSGWQIRAQVLPPAATAYPVVSLVQQEAAPGLVGIVIGVGDPAPTILVGGKIALQGMRAAKGTRSSTMNGTWYVDSTSLVSTGRLAVFLRGSQGIDPAAQRFTNMSTLRVVTYSLYPLIGFNSHRVGIHKRGKPSLGPRGRRLSRPSLDP